MRTTRPLVSIGLPVRNGERTLEEVIASVLAQDHDELELVICDNASTDGTEDLCRRLAAIDNRIVYCRQPQNVGLLNNFVHAIQLAKGVFFRWVGDTDWLAPNCVSRCLEAFDANRHLLLVTTQIRYIGPDGRSCTYPYEGENLRSAEPVERFCEFLRLRKGMPVDPLYALMRREPVSSMPRRNMIREDEVFAAKLALAGPWGHVPEVLAHRHVEPARLSALARKLGVPAWQACFATTLQCRDLLRVVRDAGLAGAQRRQARLAIARLFLDSHYRRFVHRGRKALRLLIARGE